MAKKANQAETTAVKEEEILPAAETAAVTEEEPAPAAAATENEAADAVVKSGFYKVKVTGFSGTYKDAEFGDDGVCEKISFATLESLHDQFPQAEITPLNEVK